MKNSRPECSAIFFMEKYLKVELDHIHLMRGGDILIHCLWIEKIMVALIILKKHPRIVRKFNQPISYKIPMVMVKERCVYWKKDFSHIIEEFIKIFNPVIDIRNKLKQIYIKRNILSHSNIKLGQKYFLYRPKNRKKLIEAGEVFNLNKIPNQANPIVLKIDYSNEINYINDFNIIQFLDQQYFLKEAVKLDVIYSHLR